MKTSNHQIVLAELNSREMFELTESVCEKISNHSAQDKKSFNTVDLWKIRNMSKPTSIRRRLFS